MRDAAAESRHRGRDVLGEELLVDGLCAELLDELDDELFGVLPGEALLDVLPLLGEEPPAVFDDELPGEWPLLDDELFGDEPFGDGLLGDELLDDELFGGEPVEGMRESLPAAARRLRSLRRSLESRLVRESDELDEADGVVADADEDDGDCVLLDGVLLDCDGLVAELSAGGVVCGDCANAMPNAPTAAELNIQVIRFGLGFMPGLHECEAGDDVSSG